MDHIKILEDKNQWIRQFLRFFLKAVRFYEGEGKQEVSPIFLSKLFLELLILVIVPADQVYMYR
jgi:hypothetical protein